MRFGVLSRSRRCRLGLEGTFRRLRDGPAQPSTRNASGASETGALSRDLIRRLPVVIGAAVSQRQRWRNTSTKRHQVLLFPASSGREYGHVCGFDQRPRPGGSNLYEVIRALPGRCCESWRYGVAVALLIVGRYESSHRHIGTSDENPLSMAAAYADAYVFAASGHPTVAMGASTSP
jgi:hypothetical protein